MPTVKAGMRMCQPMSQANCRRDRRTGSRSMTTSLEPGHDIGHTFGGGSGSVANRRAGLSLPYHEQRQGALSMRTGIRYRCRRRPVLAPRLTAAIASATSAGPCTHEPPSDWPFSAGISLHRREAMPQDSVATVENFWREVWKQPQNPDAIDRLVHEDFVITSGGQDIAGREAFKTWVK